MSCSFIRVTRFIISSYYRRRLALSTNNIDRIAPLNGMSKLKILSLGRNLIKKVSRSNSFSSNVILPFKIERLEDVSSTLEELWISYNQITTLDGISCCTNLTTLYISNNLIKSWAELDKLVSNHYHHHSHHCHHHIIIITDTHLHLIDFIVPIDNIK